MGILVSEVYMAIVALSMVGGESIVPSLFSWISTYKSVAVLRKTTALQDAIAHSASVIE